MANKNGFAYRYRLVAAEKIGRAIRKDETVHHINGKTGDDRPENLVVLSRSQHRLVHATEEADRRGYDLLTQKRCRICKEVKLRTEFSPSGTRGRTFPGPQCRPCAAALQRAYRRNHPDRIAATRKRRRLNGK